MRFKPVFKRQALSNKIKLDKYAQKIYKFRKFEVLLEQGKKDHNW